MSFRPTIAVRFGDEIADVGYYRNWFEEDLLIEAAAIAAAYSSCRSVEEYRERAFGRQDISYIVAPELIPNTQENLRWFIECSELPVNVDLKARCIYVSEEAIPARKLRKLPRARLDPRGINSTDFYKALSNGCFPFRSMDLGQIRDMILGDSSLQGKLSRQTLEALKSA